MKKTTFTIPKPRNPLAVPARFRHAGAHRPHGSSQRQQANRAVSREIEHLKQSP